MEQTRTAMLQNFTRFLLSKIVDDYNRMETRSVAMEQVISPAMTDDALADMDYSCWKR